MVEVDFARCCLFAGGFEQRPDDLETFGTQIAGIGDIGAGGGLAHAGDITYNFKQVLRPALAI